MKRRSSKPPPWKRPSRIVWFVLAIVGSCWFILHMPAESYRIKTAATVVESSRSADPPAMPASAGATPAKSSAPAASGKDKGSQPMQQRSRQRSDAEKIALKLQTFVSLFSFVGIAAFLGTLMEARRWHMALANVMGRMTRMARLPEIVGLAMPTALFSGAAANSLLVSSHTKGQIRTSALIAGGMANSYLAYISDSLRVLYPVIGAIGLPGVWYFGIQFTGGFCVVLCVLLWNRWYVSGHGGLPYSEEAPRVNTSSLPWPGAIAKAVTRSLSLLFRMVYLTLPLMLGIEWLLKSGNLAFWENAIPPTLASLFPAELLSVAAAQMGGLIQSSAVAANFRTEGLIDNTQILLAMLVGNVVGNPIRMLRRNLPTALGIFPLSVALTVVLGMQFSRFLISLAAIAAIIAMVVYAK